MADQEHVLDGGDCWCGAKAEELSAGVIGKVPTAHFSALSRRATQEREAALVSRERAAAVAHLRAKADAYATDPTLVSGKGALEMAADDLERGAHRG